MYTVTLDDESEQQVDALPPAALAPFAELPAMLEAITELEISDTGTGARSSR